MHELVLVTYDPSFAFLAVEVPFRLGQEMAYDSSSIYAPVAFRAI